MITDDRVCVYVQQWPRHEDRGGPPPRTAALAVSAPIITSATGDRYQHALRALAGATRAFWDWWGDEAREDQLDSWLLVRHARRVNLHLDLEDYRPRTRRTRADVHRAMLRRLADAIEAALAANYYDDGPDGDDARQHLLHTLDVAADTADRHDAWAPEDDTANPVLVVDVPTPNPTAPAINGVRQGDVVQGRGERTRRRVLTGPDADGRVRLSDRRDGGALFAGRFVPADQLGTVYTVVPACDRREAAAR
ncbi:MAG TPA: hypothetical protein VGO80_06090 [Solirubrobacteraceae bacterium]|nr:hypothetical protein [Solirubrobacteraceae bacterium]